MYQSDNVAMREYSVYRFRWYTIYHGGFNKHPTTDYCFCTEIREIQKDNTIIKMFSVRTLQVNEILKKIWVCVWYQDDIYLAYHILVGTFQLGTTVRKKLK